MVLKELIKAPKGSSFSIVDASLVAISKSVVIDGFVQPFVSKLTGGSPVLNVIGKVLVAGVSGKMISGKAGNIIGTSLMVSAGDDVAQIIGLGGKAQPSGKVRQTAGDDTFGQANQGQGISRFI